MYVCKYTRDLNDTLGRKLNHSDTNNNDSFGGSNTHGLRDPIKSFQQTLRTWKSDLPFTESETKALSNCITQPSNQAGNPRALHQCATMLNASVSLTTYLLLPRTLSDLNTVYCSPIGYPAPKICPLTASHLERVQGRGGITLIFQATKLRLREQLLAQSHTSQEAGELQFEPCFGGLCS